MAVEPQPLISRTGGSWSTACNTMKDILLPGKQMRNSVGIREHTHRRQKAALRAEPLVFGAPEESDGPVRNPQPSSRRFRAPLERRRPASASRKQAAAEAAQR